MKFVLHELSAAQRRRAIAKGPRSKALRIMLNEGVVFVHIPKCGGKSVVRDVYGLTEHEWFGHAGISFYRALLGPRGFARAFKFAFVRNPVTRCQSGFDFAKRGGFGLESDLLRGSRIGNRSFEEFVLGGLLEEMAADDAVFRPQASYIFFSDGRLGVDRICAFERFQKEMTLLPLPKPVSSPSHVNAAPSSSVHPIATEVKARIRKIYEGDYQAMARLGDAAPDWAKE